ncbi:MAG: fumarylacetoacetate hydrolase family protein [Rhodospirillales bacterium]|nr:fumarylacetoacetate hydrolase family protein [Rhodospirillales bacterium]
MNFVFPPHPTVSIEVSGSNDRFPVRRIYCVGRNYAEHVREMGHDDREPPFFFQKPADAIVANGGEFPYPPKSDNVHHEIELVVAIGKGGKDIPVDKALDHIFGYAVGIDMTRRDLQGEAKKMGRPWDVGKAFDHAAPCAAIVPVEKIGHPDKGSIWIKVNGEMKQDGDLSEQIWNVQEALSYLSGLFELVPGDLIYTGTPAGVGPVVKGDVMEGGIEGIGEIKITVV